MMSKKESKSSLVKRKVCKKKDKVISENERVISSRIKSFFFEEKKIPSSFKDKFLNFFVKLFLFIFIVGTFLYVFSSYSNHISLLAVSENSKGEIVSGNVIGLDLKVVPGSGNIYTNLNTLTEIDTQVSIVNSVKTACKLFSLDCSLYDFYFNFNSSATVLKGPSASAAIGILTVKTLLKEKLNESVAITGSLSSGGIIGNVGGVEEKVKVASKSGISTVLIPEFSSFNSSVFNSSNVKVIRVLDLVGAYKYFSDSDILNSKRKVKFNFDNSEEYFTYKKSMRNLSKNLCKRTSFLLSYVNSSFNNSFIFSLSNNSNINLSSPFNLSLTNLSNDSLNNALSYKDNMLLKNFYVEALKNYNFSKRSLKSKNYYSAASFCYSANINLQKIIGYKRRDDSEMYEDVELLKNYLIKFKLKFKERYRDIRNLNDLYIYMIVLDRVEEALDYIKSIEKDFRELNKLSKKKDELERVNCSVCKNGSLSIANVSFNCSKICSQSNLSNNSKLIVNLSNVILSDIEKRIHFLKDEINGYFASAFERNFTISLWSSLFNQISGREIIVNRDDLAGICFKILKINKYNNELLNQYGIYLFNKEIAEFNEYENVFTNDFSDYSLCIYRGLEINGKINSVLNSNGVKENLSKVVYDVLNVTEDRIKLFSNEFPLVSYIYYEYGKNLAREGSYSSSFLYLNYALSFNDLNIYFKKDNQFNFKYFFNGVLSEFASNSLYSKVTFFLLFVLLIFS